MTLVVWLLRGVLILLCSGSGSLKGPPRSLACTWQETHLTKQTTTRIFFQAGNGSAHRTLDIVQTPALTLNDSLTSVNQ
jgi:hypothetical protein